ncbi:MAG TPA: tRNA (adenosine(37)-N6)-dimethylallyltransferase MiaA [bacterium]|nr:tRNA (adenosine(37)-N6)-dimethylallyltransferase MiaA [bacterium]
MVQADRVSETAIVMVAGPTAAGKTAFAESLALEQGGELLNADSQQFYRGFDIGTGKTPPAERRVPQHLLDLCEPGQGMSAAEFSRLADAQIAELGRRGKLAVVVGGTGLYLKALCEGLDELPSRDAKIRGELQAEWQAGGGPEMHRRLEEIDPEVAARVPPTDPVRLVRYLEIARITGEAPSRLLRRERPVRLRYPVQSYWLQPDRAELRARIARRVAEMFEKGWLEEVERLLRRGIDPRRLESKPLGYAECTQVLSGRLSQGEAEAKIVLKTSQYAKRQETYFRGLFSHPAYTHFGSSLQRF